MPSFSTCWNNSRHTDGYEIITEILELGFQSIELSHGTTITKLPGFQKAYAENLFTCSGVHNYFPSPTEVMIDAPDAYEYTSHRPYDRQRSLELSLKTLETAAEFNARYVVIHLGSVPLMPHSKWTKQLINLLREGKEFTPEYGQLKTKCVAKREKAAPIYFNRAIDALETLVQKATELKIPLALESRSKYEDFPTTPEMLKIQQHFKDETYVGYWHDFGHVQLQHNLGILDHQTWLTTIKPYLIGGHVHDVEWPQRDHRVPFIGTIEYRDLIPLFPAGCPLVWELSPTRSSKQIIPALEIWKKIFPDR